MKEATHNGLQVYYQDVRLMPGESFQVTYTVTVSAEAAEELDVRVTPTAQHATHNGLQVYYQDVRLMPGESFQVTYTVTVSAEAAEELDVRVTPTAQHARKGEIGDILADAE